MADLEMSVTPNARPAPKRTRTSGSRLPSAPLSTLLAASAHDRQSALAERTTVGTELAEYLTRVLAMVFPPLHLQGERLRPLARLPCGGVLERFDRSRLIEVEHDIELVW